VDSQQNPVVRTLTRYGLPIVVLVFYVTASLNLAFTPDSTFVVLQFVRSDSGIAVDASGTPSPLWLGLLKLGSFSGLDLLLVAKVFSLVFGCTVILAAFLLGSEVTGNRLLGLMAALATAMSVWVLREGPSGGALPLVITLALMTLFFLQRNEYVLAAILMGLCILLFWQGAVLALFLIVDVILNSIDKIRGVKVASSLLLVIAGVLFPWALVAWLFGLNPLPHLPVYRGMTPDSFAGAAVVLVFALAALGFFRTGTLPGTLSAELGFNITPVLWMATLLLLGVFVNSGFFLIALPIGTVYAFRAVRTIFGSFSGEKGIYQLSVILAALILVLNQVSYAFFLRPAMDLRMESVKPLMEIGAWLGLHAPADAVIVAEEQGTVGYYAQRAVGRVGEAGISGADIVIATAVADDHFVRVFSPSDTGNGGYTEPVAVWKRTGPSSARPTGNQVPQVLRSP
jgi:hypothetical protein